MNWWTMVAMAREIMSEAPQLISDVKALIDKLHSHLPAPPDVLEALPDEVTPQ